jgi:hypothetical protein
MTLDEFKAASAADDNAFWRLDDGDRKNLIEEALDRLHDMTADRDSWLDQCMDARKVWHETKIELDIMTTERNLWRALAETAQGMAGLAIELAEQARKAVDSRAGGV